MSFYRTRTHPRGGPDGGDGGDGGRVILKATHHVKDFEHLKKKRHLKQEMEDQEQGSLKKEP